MLHLALPRACRRVMAAIPLVVALSVIAQPAAAAGDPNGDVNAAKQALQGAQAQATTVDTALSGAQSNLAAANAQLTALHNRIRTLDAAVAADTSSVNRLTAQLATDRGRLAAYLRQSYENGGSVAALMYLLESKDIAMVIQRKVQLDHVTAASQHLVDSINSDATQATHALAAATAARAQLHVAEQQARTTQAIVAVEEEQVKQADVAAHQAVSADQNQLVAALAAQAAALAAARAQTDLVYSPVPADGFTVDTDLAQPSSETPARINGFLQGTAMAGLGDSFMHAEQSYHVSARYFVAHAILESAWGSSAIARDKHNLFGFNADDANPYKDATTFPSFDACIQYVAQFIAQNYLTPGGRYFHGPTLRGMNVDYATDPQWAEKIAAIAQTVP